MNLIFRMFKGMLKHTSTNYGTTTILIQFAGTCQRLKLQNNNNNKNNNNNAL
jgi:hypothetical protein